MGGVCCSKRDQEITDPKAEGAAKPEENPDQVLQQAEDEKVRNIATEQVF
jgi:hypothetical protein